MYGVILWYINMKDGPCIQEMWNLKVEEIRRYITLVREHRKAAHHVTNPITWWSVLTREPVFHILKRSKESISLLFSFYNMLSYDI